MRTSGGAITESLTPEPYVHPQHGPNIPNIGSSSGAPVLASSLARERRAGTVTSLNLVPACILQEPIILRNHTLKEPRLQQGALRTVRAGLLRDIRIQRCAMLPGVFDRHPQAMSSSPCLKLQSIEGLESFNLQLVKSANYEQNMCSHTGLHRSRCHRNSL